MFFSRSVSDHWFLVLQTIHLEIPAAHEYFFLILQKCQHCCQAEENCVTVTYRGAVRGLAVPPGFSLYSSAVQASLELHSAAPHPHQQGQLYFFIIIYLNEHKIKIFLASRVLKPGTAYTIWYKIRSFLYSLLRFWNTEWLLCHRLRFQCSCCKALSIKDDSSNLVSRNSKLHLSFCSKQGQRQWCQRRLQCCFPAVWCPAVTQAGCVLSWSHFCYNINAVISDLVKLAVLIITKYIRFYF